MRRFTAVDRMGRRDAAAEEKIDVGLDGPRGHDERTEALRRAETSDWKRRRRVCGDRATVCGRRPITSLTVSVGARW